jgi:hypothetical protein
MATDPPAQLPGATSSSTTAAQPHLGAGAHQATSLLQLVQHDASRDVWQVGDDALKSCKNL